MSTESSRLWKEGLVALAFGGAGLFIALDDRTPSWLRGSLGILAMVAPLLPVLALIPWHFIALRRGLANRSSIPCEVSLSEGIIHFQRGSRRTEHALDAIARARFARNENWTESKILEDALGLFTSNGREVERLPASTIGLEKLLVALGARGIQVEQVDVSAPAVLD